ncbi:6TM ABC transporter family protein [Chitinophaga sancti]|uniref:Uncharacterized protein n=1 Tax=Chitinophaga sancti TaxID=1004 RepID=A0A1K1SV37_9BACT|nr:hypothetical protein [Chitinophaga sancti]WQD63792.1 hypothetical protein U0033_05240 [Chitinophaga sancti]WQG90583.1 hypothetical protein SR876_03680 [Chitinophaga sancti]SFW88100.1 hypothetical protein SAMN05661012_06192 [Chitinophaga sancti]
MTTTEIVTLSGIGLTFFVGVFNLIITFRNVRKTAFINSVTSSRIKYIQELRASISKFCGLAHSYANKIYKLEYKEVWELHKEADNLRFLIRLYLNPEDEYWDNKIINLIDEILLKSDKDPTEPINELIKITQYLLKLEWEGAKRESEIGIISDIEKKELYNKYVERHKKAALKNENR